MPTFDPTFRLENREKCNALATLERNETGSILDLTQYLSELLGGSLAYRPQHMAPNMEPRNHYFPTSISSLPSWFIFTMGNSHETT